MQRCRRQHLGEFLNGIGIKPGFAVQICARRVGRVSCAAARRAWGNMIGVSQLRIGRNVGAARREGSGAAIGVISRGYIRDPLRGSVRIHNAVIHGAVVYASHRAAAGATVERYGAVKYNIEESTAAALPAPREEQALLTTRQFRNIPPNAPPPERLAELFIITQLFTVPL